MAHRNVVLITIDAWRPDFVDAHAGVRLTPALDRVADRTVRFDRAYANAPWTSPAMASVFTGQAPAEHGVHFEWSTPRPGGPALVRDLLDAGFVATNLSYLNELENYWHLGYAPEQTPARPAGPDDPTLVEALGRCAGGPPFFLWFHYKWVHLPYWASAPDRAALGIDDAGIPDRLRASVCTGFVVPRGEHALLPEDADPVRRLYAAGVLEMNRWLDGVFDALDALGLWETTSVVLTSDHGEELLEHGHVGHASTAHHATLYEEVLRIPLLVIDARVRRPRRLQTRVQGLDLFPTLHGLAGVPSPPCAGADLGPAIFGVDEPVVPGDRVFHFHSARMGCPTPRSRADQWVEGTSDGVTKRIVERFDAPRAWTHDLRSDPEERVRLP